MDVERDDNREPGDAADLFIDICTDVLVAVMPLPVLVVLLLLLILCLWMVPT